MPLKVFAALGFATNFSARCLAPVNQSPFLGICLLTANNTGAAPIQMLSATTDASGEFLVYGPTRAFTLQPKKNIPIGIAFRRNSNNTNPASATLIIRFRERGLISTVTIGLVATIEPLTSALFFPSIFEFVASRARSKSQMISLQCQQQVSSFSASVLPPNSAFSDTLLIHPFTHSVPTMSVNFDLDPKKNDATQILTVTATEQAGTSSVPLICWTAETVLPGELAITGIVADPPGPDLPNEFITISNVSARTLDLTGCTLQDEGGGIGNATFFFPFPPEFALPAGASIKVHTGPGANTASDLFMNRTRPVWDNDFDAALISNCARDPVANFAYIFALPGVRIQKQSKLIDKIIFVDQAFRSTFTGVILEDGDFVVLQPDPRSLSFAGNILYGETGPDGVPGSAAPDDDTGWPLPGAPLFALLAKAGKTTLVGSSTLAQVVNRTSALRPDNPLNLLINDSAAGGLGASGGYLVRVRIFRN